MCVCVLGRGTIYLNIIIDGLPWFRGFTLERRILRNVACTCSVFIQSCWHCSSICRLFRRILNVASETV